MRGEKRLKHPINSKSWLRSRSFLQIMMGVAAGETESQKEDLPDELWAIYKKEREHRENVKEWIAGTIAFAKNTIPYCHLSKNILDITPNKGISTAQAVYISTIAMSLDPNRDRAHALVNAFLEYSSDYRETLEFLLNKKKKEEAPTAIEILREDLVDMFNGLKMDVNEQRANIDQLYEEVFNKGTEEEEDTQHCECLLSQVKEDLQPSFEIIKMSIARIEDVVKDYRLSGQLRLEDCMEKVEDDIKITKDSFSVRLADLKNEINDMRVSMMCHIRNQCPSSNQK